MDIISEVERGLNGLKRQAGKAERWKALSARLFSLEVALAAREWDRHTNKLAETDALIEQLSDEDLGHGTRISSLGADVESVRTARTEAARELSDLENAHHEARRKLDRLENDLAAARSEATRLAGEAERLGQEQAELQRRQEKISGERAGLESGLAENLSALEKARAEAAEKEALLSTVRGELAGLNLSMEGIRSRYTDLVAEETRCRNNLTSATRTSQEIARKLRQKSEEASEAEKRAEAARKKSEAARVEAERLRAEIALAETRLTATESALESRRAELRETIAAAHAADMALGKMKSRLSTLKRMEAGHEWYGEAVRHVLKLRDEAKKSAEPGPDAGLKLIAEAVTVEPGYEDAVEAALGPALQYVLVPDPASALEIFGKIPEKVTGKLGFAPLSWAGRPENPADAPSENALISHVSTAPDFAGAVGGLLNGVLAAADAQEALALRDSAPEALVVTRDGALSLSRRFLSAGKRGEAGPGILAQKNEMRELAARIEKAAEELADLKARQAELEAGAKALESELQKLIQSRKSLGKSEADAARDLVRLEEESRMAERRREISALELEQLSGDEDDARGEVSRFSDLVSRIAVETAKAKEDLDANSEQTRAVGQKAAALEQELLDAKLSVTALAARSDNPRDSIARLSSYAEEGARRLVQLEYDQKRKERQADEARERIRTGGEGLTSAYAVFEDLSGGLEKKRAQLTEIEEELAQSEAALAKTERDRKSLSEKIQTVKLARAERAIRRDSAASRVLERFGRELAVLRQEPELPDLSGEEDFKAADAEVNELREKISRMGDVNTAAIAEYAEEKERHDFLVRQKDDLLAAIDDLEKVIRKINRFTQERFMETFARVNEKLGEVIPKLFAGGSAQLILSEPDKPLETGVEYLIQPHGKKVTRMSLLSGGEKALAAIAFVFAIFLIKPSSFCLMDEVDAPLDDANVFRFNQLMKMIGEQSQVIMITHNKNAMEFADLLFGVTMETKGVSKLVSVNLSSAA